MPYTADRRLGIGSAKLAQFRYAARALVDRYGLRVFVLKGDTGAVISPVFQQFKGVQNRIYYWVYIRISYYSTHLFLYSKAPRASFVIVLSGHAESVLQLPAYLPARARPNCTEGHPPNTSMILLLVNLTFREVWRYVRNSCAVLDCQGTYRKFNPEGAYSQILYTSG